MEIVEEPVGAAFFRFFALEIRSFMWRKVG